MKTYNVELQYETSQADFWLNNLKEAQNCFNYVSTIAYNEKIYSHITLHKRCYYEIKKFNLTSQMLCKVLQEVGAMYKSVISNKNLHKLEKPITKKSYSMRLDKHICNYFTKDSISMISSTHNKRTTVLLKNYDKSLELFSKYTPLDPLLYYKDEKFYLSIPFDIPVIIPSNTDVLGVDLGLKRLFTTSDGVALSGKEYNRHKRRIRHLKDLLKSKSAKGSKNAKRHLKKLSKQERNFSKDYIHKSVNELLKTKKDVIVIEDLTKVKSKNKGKRFNNRLSQMPFYMFKSILTYKAQHLGKSVETVSPAYTSKIDCLTHKKEGRRVGCRFYGQKVLDADWNAAINIAYRKHSFSFSEPIDGKLDLKDRLLLASRMTVSNETVKAPCL